MKYICELIIDDYIEDKKEDFFANEEDENKKMILDYLKSFNEPVSYGFSRTIDVFTGKTVHEADNGFSDGEYTWYQSELYHYEKYNLRLTEEFKEYVMSKIK